MASRAAAEAVLLLAVALLLPLRLLSLALRPQVSSPRRTRSAAGLFAVAVLVTAICAVPDAGTRPGAADADADALRSEVEALRLKVARLESMLEENTKALSSKASILEEDSKLIAAMERDIQLLMNGQDTTKNTQSKSYSSDNIKDMEDELSNVSTDKVTIPMGLLLVAPEVEERRSTVNSPIWTGCGGTASCRLLPTALAVEMSSRADIGGGLLLAALGVVVQQLQQEVSKINSNAYAIESLARDAEKRVEALSSEVKKMEDIIAEQWIQIRQFEQAFVLTKMMTSKVHERSKPSKTVYTWPGKDTILKYVSNVDLNGTFLRGASYARSCFSHTYQQSRRFVQAMNRFYHEVTRFRKAIRRQSIPDIDRADVFFLGGSISKRSCISLPYKQFKNSMSSAQKFHHKVQVFIQNRMISNSYSRGLANEPVTFFLVRISYSYFTNVDYLVPILNAIWLEKMTACHETRTMQFWAS
ncbi:hypothetical protein EJB05_24059, partial [Eragrostis curvula]